MLVVKEREGKCLLRRVFVPLVVEPVDRVLANSAEGSGAEC